MAYSKAKDVELAKWEIEGDDNKVLEVSVYSYNGGEPKLQIGPRTYVKKDGSKAFGKAGRMTASEVAALAGLLVSVVEAMDKAVE